MTNSARAQISVNLRELDATLGKIEAGFGRSQALLSAFQGALIPIAEEAAAAAPQPGKPGYTPRYGERKTRTHLRDTIGAAVGLFDSGRHGSVLWGLVGPQYPAGASAHMVEFGHRIVVHGSAVREPGARGKRLSQPKSKRGLTGLGQVVGRVGPRPFMHPAFERTKDDVMPLLTAALEAEVERQGRP